MLSPRRPLPEDGAVEVVVVADVTPLAGACALPGDEEQAAARLASEQLRARARGGRCLLRLTAGAYLGLAPEEVSVSRARCPRCGAAGSDHAKPVVAAGSGLFANLSGSGDAAAVAVATGEVGVDIERRGAAADPARLARRFFAPLEADFVEAASGAERDERFARLWVRKEALLKATGEGIAGGLDSSVLLGATPLTLERAVGAERWLVTVADLDLVGPEQRTLAGAVARAGAACSVRLVSPAALGLPAAGSPAEPGVSTTAAEAGQSPA